MLKRAAGLVQAFRVAIDQRQYSLDLASLTAVHAEQQLLLREAFSASMRSSADLQSLGKL
eukprot:6209366-Pleurochrysis_carterae.AAC.4